MKFSVVPTSTNLGDSFTVVVNLENPTSTDNVTVAIGTNPEDGVLSGTLTVASINGVAFFDNLEIDTPGVGYTLTAIALQQRNEFQAGYYYNYPPCGTIYSHNSVLDAAEHANLNPAPVTVTIESNPITVTDD